MDISRYSIYPDIVYIWVSPAPTCEFPPLILDYPDIQIIRIRIILDYPGLSGYYTFTLLTPSLPPSQAHPDAQIREFAQSRTT
jgi:hypothetical protein